MSSRAWVLTLASGEKMLSPRHGTGVQIYYEGCSEPKTFEFLCKFLDRGMNVIDVGAHLGEYTLLCAGKVGGEGRVHAFEPNEELIGFLERSIALNGFSNVLTNTMAVADRPGDREFDISRNSAISALRSEGGQTGRQGRGLCRTVVVPT